jgi:hypothetical protein
MYRHWHDDQDRYTKIVLKPGMQGVERVANDTASQEKQHEPA